MKKGPLAGKTILVTRAKEQAKELSDQIKQQGGIPIEVPLIAFQSIYRDQVRYAINHILEYDWIIFTSVNGVRFFMNQFQRNHQVDVLSSLKIAVVGTKTEQYLTKWGLRANIIPDEYVAEGLIDSLKGNIKEGDKVLIARGNLGRAKLRLQLEELGASVLDVAVYETVCPIEAKQQLESVYQTIGKLDYVTFTSSSTVTHYIQILIDLKREIDNSNSTVACIGPIAALTATKFGLRVDIVPHTYTIDHLVKEIVRHSKEEHRL
ncbi:uroporphyrinogen-III synthase [Alkalihalobacillus sp. MEB130]|uniref:uroporphyrinogen-III synthase n=1 Tax=Alkalihalobacillus sp. MEB130 TaxID=2976704 RepID=UPI0028E004F8|nr:uroporphyrinogen-III synthase [Alkalihalobacillus sp. MEB130]MDT8859500.1 uroporphyrinogen-III synthase [Alkalihalobacillus sp. MEB130]